MIPRLWMTLVLSAGMVYADDYGRPPKVPEWSLAGRIEVEGKTEDLSKQDVKFQLVRVGENGLNRYPGGIVLQLKVLPSGAFSIVSARKSPLTAGHYHIGMTYGGRFAATERTIPILPESAKHEDIVLRFGPVEQSVLQFRVIDPQSRKGIPDVKVSVCISKEHHVSALTEMHLGETKTNQDGRAEMTHVPLGRFLVAYFGPGPRMALETILGPGRPMVTSSAPESIGQDGGSDILFLPVDMGMLWEPLAIDGRPADPGSVWKLTAVTSGDLIDARVWKPELVLKLTVDEYGVIKSPPIPDGRYRLTCIDKDSTEETTADVWGFSPTIEMVGWDKRLKEIEAKKEEK